MIRSPKDFLFVRLEKTFEDEIVTSNGVKLYRDTNLNPEWAATAVGKIVGIPDKITKDKVKLVFNPDLKGLVPEAEVGDEVIFSYQVVNDCELRENDTPIFNNRFFYNGEFLWKVDYQQVYGYFKNGKLVPASGFVFLEELEEQITGVDLKDLLSGSNVNIDKYIEQLGDKGGIVTASIGQTVKQKNKARVVAIGRNKEHEPILGVKEGDKIRYDERFGMKYEIKGKKYIILQQSRIVAKEI